MSKTNTNIDLKGGVPLVFALFGVYELFIAFSPQGNFLNFIFGLVSCGVSIGLYIPFGRS